MSRIVVITNLTLDGVMQAPGDLDEDTRGGFEHSGRAAPFAAMQQHEAGAALSTMGTVLFGRLTYEHFYAFWPKQPDNPFTNCLNNIPTFVVSTTLRDPLPRMNSTLIQGDVA